jgi:hypothetical protein
MPIAGIAILLATQNEGGIMIRLLALPLFG